MKPGLPLLTIGLAQALGQGDPAQTPEGGVEYTHAFPMGGENLVFQASLWHADGQLQAQVVQEEGEWSRPVFQAVWTVDQGVWRFSGATHDATPINEQAAVAVFQDYVQALAVAPSAPAPRRRFGR